MKIKLTKKIKNIDGKDDPSGLTSGQVLAAYLQDITTNNAVEMFELGKKLVRNEEIEISVDFYNQITKIVELSNLPNKYKAPITSGLLPDSTKKSGD